MRVVQVMTRCKKKATQNATYSRRDILGVVRMEITARNKLEWSARLEGSRNNAGYKYVAKQHAGAQKNCSTDRT